MWQHHSMTRTAREMGKENGGEVEKCDLSVIVCIRIVSLIVRLCVVDVVSFMCLLAWEI